MLPALELISTLAQSAPGDDGCTASARKARRIRRHLRAARAIKALLVLDVQPGQADFFEEVRALEPYLSQPDVGLALDPEWSVPEGTQPGSVIGVDGRRGGERGLRLPGAASCGCATCRRNC